MTVLYVYAIADAPSRPPIPGLQGARLSGTGVGGVFAIWSEHDGPPEADETALLEHERVVEALQEEAAVLPMRFGSCLPDREALRAFLLERRDEFALALEHVRGAVELGVRAMMRSEPAVASAAPVADRPGTAYMLARLNGEKRSAAVASRIHEPLKLLSRASQRRRSSLAGAVNTAYLVDREYVDAFQSAVEQLDEELADATVVCTGPWPPYSFTPEEGSRR